MTKEEFIEGVQVKIFDDGKLIRGEVVTFDYTMNKVFIEWDDLLDPVWHHEEEFKSIKKL